MDKRIAEICHLLPHSRYQKGVIAGFQDKQVIDGFRKWVENLRIDDVGKADKWEKDSFDLIITYFPGRLRSSIIKDTFSALRNGGTAAFLVRSRASASSVKNTILNQTDSQGLVLEVYGLTPSLEDVRLAVPLQNRACAAASLALYQPSLMKARIMKYAAYFLGRAGLSSLWAPCKLIIFQKGSAGSLNGLPLLTKKLFRQPVEYALFTGTPGYLRKSTVQIMDPTGAILGYCKIGDNPQTRDVLSNEAELLRFVNALSLGNAQAPEALFAGDTGAAAYLLIQSTRKGHLSAGPLIPDVRHLDLLTKLMGQTKCESAFRASACYREVNDRLSSVRGYAGEQHYQEIKDALEWSSHVLNRERIMLCLAHRDFTPWNTYVSDGKLFVFDWEFARPNWAPLTDAFHFILQKGILVDKAQPDTLWNRLMSESSKEGRFVRQCASTINASGDTLLVLLAFYLCDMTTMYLFHYGQEAETPPDGVRLISTWRKLLQMTQERRGA